MRKLHKNQHDMWKGLKLSKNDFLQADLVTENRSLRTENETLAHGITALQGSLNHAIALVSKQELQLEKVATSYGAIIGRLCNRIAANSEITPEMLVI